jgi:hypothetical protein
MRLPAVLAVLTAFAVLLPRAAHADPPSAELMARLASTSAAMEAVRKRASFAIDGHVEMLDGDGKVESVQTTQARIVKDGKGTHILVDRAIKDGKDVTEDERKKAAKDEAKSEEDKKKEEIENPFLAALQPKYIFDQTQTDATNPSRVLVTFTPREPSDHTVEGSAWVDTTAGQFLSAGLKVSKPGMFVDFIHLTIEVGVTTELGPAISRLTFDGKGGFLFIHKHFRGSQVLSDYKITRP